MQGTVDFTTFTTFTTWPFWVCVPRRAPGFTTFTTLKRALVAAAALLASLAAVVKSGRRPLGNP